MLATVLRRAAGFWWLPFLANQATYYLVSGKAPVRMGNAHASVVPYQTFPTTDGWMLIACGNDGQFAKMMQVLGDPAMADDERYKTNAARVLREVSGDFSAHVKVSARFAPNPSSLAWRQNHRVRKRRRPSLGGCRRNDR